VLPTPQTTSPILTGNPVDYRESFPWRYEPRYDPDPKDPNAVQPEVLAYIHGEDYFWQGTSHLPGFKTACITYWQACLTVARHLVRIFALALDLPESYFDALTTYPGSDGVFNFDPAISESEAAKSTDIGLGSHANLQCFTLLWQDIQGGLRILSHDGQWLKVTPEPGTLVFNIGYYLMRLTNKRMKFMVHRVYNRSTVERCSMPVFFGFNFNEKVGVLESVSMRSIIDHLRRLVVRSDVS
jgi:isopenicillin N synthase-like dioxygenase